MLQDLAKYDLIEMVAGEGLPEIEQAKVVIQFTRALSGFLAQKLPEPTAQDTQEFQALAQKPDITPDEVIAFYKSKIPNLEEMLDNAILELKKEFLENVYARYVQAAQTQIASAQDPDVKARAEKDLTVWQAALAAAQQDEWDKVKQALVTLPR